MDMEALINYHRRTNADVTIATTPADEDHALHLGILKVGGGGLEPRPVKSSQARPS
jgi:ADP-glucose pyrophosphorylase